MPFPQISLSRPIRLKLRRMVPMPTGRTGILLQRHLIATHKRAPDPLIPTPRLLDPQTPPPTRESIALTLGLGVPEPALVVLVVRVAAPGAAADAEEPEERGGPGEGDGEPDGDEGVAAEGEVDVVGVEQAAEGAEEGGEEDGAGEDGGEGEEGGGLGG